MGLCDLIINQLNKYENLQLSGGVVKVEPVKKRKTTVIRKRYCNVVFSEAVRPVLSSAGALLGRHQLTAGIKTDEALHKKIASEYNNKDKYNDDAHPALACKGSPKYNGPITWQQSCESLKGVVREYEKSCKNWKQSGNHGPFSDFTKSNNSLLYVHAFAVENPGIFDRVAGELPGDVAFESGGNGKGASIIMSRSRKKAKKKDNSNGPLEEYKQSNVLAAEATAKKNELVTGAITKASEAAARTSDMATTLMVQKIYDSSVKRERTMLKAAAEDSSVSKKDIKIRYKKYHEHRVKTEATAASTDDEDYQPDSQESLFDRVWENRKRIKKYEGQL